MRVVGNKNDKHWKNSFSPCFPRLNLTSFLLPCCHCRLCSVQVPSGREQAGQEGCWGITSRTRCFLSAIPFFSHLSSPPVWVSHRLHHGAPPPLTLDSLCCFLPFSPHLLLSLFGIFCHFLHMFSQRHHQLCTGTGWLLASSQQGHPCSLSDAKPGHRHPI